MGDDITEARQGSLERGRTEADAQFEPWTIGDLLARPVAACPDRIALISPASHAHPERRWTYVELEAQSKRAARALLSRHQPGDRVATWAAASPELVFLHCGAALAGIVLVTLNPANRAAELHYLLAQSAARSIFLDREFRGMDQIAVIAGLRASLPDLHTVFCLDAWAEFLAGADSRDLPRVMPDAAAMILFTSGTTGKPKGAVLGHQGVVNNARFSAARLEVPPASVWLNLLPMFHIGGSVTMMLGCLANQGTHVLLSEFTAPSALDAIQRYSVSLTMAVPTMLHALFDAPEFATTDFSTLQVIVTGGTVITPDLVREVRRRFGVEVMVLFGQTEAGGCMCLTHRGDSEAQVTQSVGVPLPLSEMKIRRADGSDAPRGEVGEICVRTRCSMLEYFRMPEKTAETLDAGGWVHTGDLGLLRADGYLQVTGRLKDMIIRGGENIYPREIEEALAEHPAIAQAAVFGVADPKWGEQVAAAVIRKAGASIDPDELTAYLQSRIARHKVPKVWRFVDSFPLNASGKIQKFALRDQLTASADDQR